jgi:hypothetical protein
MSAILDMIGFGVAPMFHFSERMNELKPSTTIWQPWALCVHIAPLSLAKGCYKKATDPRISWDYKQSTTEVLSSLTDPTRVVGPDYITQGAGETNYLFHQTFWTYALVFDPSLICSSWWPHGCCIWIELKCISQILIELDWLICFVNVYSHFHEDTSFS